MDQNSLRTLRSRVSIQEADAQGDAYVSVAALLQQHIVPPFSLACGVSITIHRIDDFGPRGDFGREELNQVRPCTTNACGGYCHESWAQQLHSLQKDQRTHMHQCKYGRWCAVVPVVHLGVTLASARLICSQAVTEGRFIALVEILETMIRDLMGRTYGGSLPPHKPRFLAPEPTDSASQSKPHLHPLISRAVSYIENNLNDPELSVQRVAQVLNTNTSYLSHVFATGMGQRMQTFITKHRMARAMQLLASTNWQIKRVAHECGHANANWFSQVFRTVTGSRPMAYRHKCRKRPVRAGA